MIVTGGGARILTSRFFVIATGRRPKNLGFAETGLTSATVFELREEPRRLMRLGE